MDTEREDRGSVKELSYIHKPADRDFDDRILPDYLDQWVGIIPDEEAAVVYTPGGERRSLSFRQFHNRSVKFAAGLLGTGLARHHRAIVMAPNSIEFLVIQMACSRIGVFAIFLKYGASEDDIVRNASEYKCSAVILQTHVGRESYGRRAADACKKLEINTCSDNGGLRIVCTAFDGGPNCFSYEDMLGEQSDHLSEDEKQAVFSVQAKIEIEDPMCGTLTSGTTGKPKVVASNHFQSIARCFDVAEALVLEQGSRFLNERPFSWVGGLLLAVLPVAVVGITVVSMDPEISVKMADAEAVMKILQDERCTNVLTMPYLMYDLTNSGVIKDYDLSHLKYAITGGQPIMKEACADFLAKNQTIAIIQGYGASENSVVSTQIRSPANINDPGFGYLAFITGYEAKIVDEQGRIVPRGITGELWVRGASIFIGYLDNPEATAKAVTPLRWFKTADMMVMNDQGHAKPVGRMSDSIKRATVIVQPAEVETVLIRHPNVSAVFVVGVPDARFYEELCACVKLKALQGDDKTAEDELKEIDVWCSQQFIPGPDGLSLAPRYLLAYQEFPQTVTGKLDRRGLAREAAKRLGLKRN